MISFIKEGDILRIENEKIILPITVKPGLQPRGTEEILKYFPSLRAIIEGFQKQELSVGSLIYDVLPTLADCKFHLLVIDYRPRPGVNVNYLTQALVALSAQMTSMDGGYVVAPLATEAELSSDLVQQMVQGIMGENKAEIGFYL